MKLPRFGDATTRPWDEKNGFVLFVEADKPSHCGTSEWFAEHRQEIRDALDRFGVVFFRGFADSSHRFESMIDTIAGEPLSYVGGVTPRSSVHGTVFTATDAPPDLKIVQHHEMSYHRHTPRYLCFYCEVAPPEGGATPVTDGRRFGRTMASLDPRVMRDLEEKGALFIRNYNEANMKGWRAAWYASDRSEVEQKLHEAGVEWEWLTDEWLRTRQRQPAILRDPVSEARVLFSCLHLWHRSYVATMNASTGVPLPEDPAKQPYATFFGDGSAIPDEFISLMHATYDEQAVAIPYEQNDFMIVHNLLATHGRQAYVPPRKVYVTMREKVQLTDAPFCQPAKEKRSHE
ncbi:MAG TPA: TauD/TfdA family dioxygenase [Labilithrix sp.]|nr:TauD/TfdA family dioxygenase [Labilithrix sp.]